MKIAGNYRIDAPRDAVWDAMQDPAVLARTLPGCEALEVTGDDEYAATITAGVASVKGTYKGKVRLRDQHQPERYRLQAQGAGGPGTVQADATVSLTDEDGGTLVSYDADAVVGGMIGGVGQRMLTSVAKRTADEFFAAVERELTGVPVPTPAPAGVPDTGEPVPTGERAAPAVGQVFASPAAPATDTRVLELLGAAALGAAIALLGVLVGRRTLRRET